MASADQVKQEILKYYPAYAWAVDLPGMGNFWQDAIAEADKGDGAGWDDATFMAKLQQTDWWKNTEPAVREYQQRKATDPSNINQRLREREANLWDMAQQLGFNVNAADIQTLAQQVEQFGLDDTQMNDRLMALGESKGQPTSIGSISTLIAGLRKQASTYLVGLDDATAYNMAMTVAKGEKTADDFNLLFRDQAKAKFSYNQQMVQQIDQGFTPEALFAPQRAKIASLLEVDASNINLNDPKWSQVLDYAEPGTGARRSMTESETAQMVRGTAEWKKTLNGQQAGTQLLGQITQMFQGR